MKIKDFVSGGKYWDIMNHFQLEKQGKIKNNQIPAGAKVKFNLDKILSFPDFLKSNPKYRDFVYENKDEVFTVEYDKEHEGKSCLLSLKEDNTVPKWLFYNGYFDIIDKKVE